jgi:hypothetical protein
MTLCELAALYATETAASDGYRSNLLRTARRLGSYGLTALRQLSPDSVNAILQKLDASTQTRHNIRREILTLWRWAYDRQWCQIPPLRLHRVKVRPRPVEAWSMGLLESLLGAAAGDATPISRRWPTVTRAMVLPPWIGLGFDTGLRFADIHELTIHSFRNQCVAVSAKKTGKVTVRPLSDDTADEVARLFKLSPDGTLFKWAVPRRRAFVMWQSFLADHKIGGSSKFLRRSCATYLHKKKPGQASDYLSHSDPKLVWKHYLDQTLLDMPEGPPSIRRAK